MRRTEIIAASLILLIAAAGQAQARGLPISLDHGTARVLLSLGAGLAPATAYLFRDDRRACLALALVSVLCLAVTMVL
jgi:hypothetical protein